MTLTKLLEYLEDSRTGQISCQGKVHSKIVDPPTHVVQQNSHHDDVTIMMLGYHSCLYTQGLSVALQEM